MAKFAKFWTAFAGAVATLLAANLIPDPYATWVSAIVAAVSTFLVYLIPNSGQPVDTDGLPEGDGDPGEVTA